ncbi:MAG TPA: dihydrodipicolinate synthase family protein [Phycisphaerae bacterium]|nr:dihydrodipicolinate synthase family protein [Phycisphaerae bacterium]
MLTTLTPHRLTQSVLAVPPLCRNADYTLSPTENAKLIRHIEAGGVNTLLYGGNANFYHVGAAEYGDILTLLESFAAADTLVIPSVGPTFGTAIDQAGILRGRAFPTAMLLPMQGAVTPAGVDLGIRRFVDAAVIPAILYIRSENYIDPPRVAKLFDDHVILAVKYAVVRKDPADDPYLRALCDHVNPARIISGLGEQPAITHMRDFALGGFTAGIVCIAPHISHQLLAAIRNKNFPEAERLRALCKPLEDLRDALNPIRVLHEAVRLANIADTGPLLPLLSNLPESDHPPIRDAARTLLTPHP